MCGRYATTRSAADLSALFDAAFDAPDEAAELEPRYNVAPTDPAPVVRVSKRRGVRELAVGRWGLLPHWARDPRAAARMINARAETVATTRAYADSYATRRALVPVDGWYEWLRNTAGGREVRRLRDGTGGRQPYFMTPRDGAVLALAGLWSRWGPDGLLTFSVVTTAAVGELVAVHDRMPLVLPPQRWEEWLASEPPDRLLVPPPERLVSGLEIRPVGPAVGNVRNDGPELVRRVDLPPPPGDTQPALF